ncbi:class I SAM-dependent DNA methyltransferase [Actinoplanes sp. CA-131856]
MTANDDIALWDSAAEQYATHDGDSFYRRLSPFLWRQLGDVTGQPVLDLGCGHGWLAEKMRLAGAAVTGIDGSTALLARAAEAYPGIAFVSHMVLMDLPELDTLVADVRASLTGDGVFVFSILHPSFFHQAPVEDPGTGERYRKVNGYLRHERRWITTFGGHNHYHRPLSWYVDLLTRHGLAVTGLHEPPTLPQHGRPEEEWSDYERWFATIPTMLAVACRPMPPSSHPFAA